MQKKKAVDNSRPLVKLAPSSTSVNEESSSGAAPDKLAVGVRKAFSNRLEP